MDRPVRAETKLLPERQRVVLVLQGGGALGSYQAGVYQALHEHGYTPDWVVGTSIGAINAALIAGSDPTCRLDHLHEFWDGIAHADLFDMRSVPDPARRINIWLSIFDTYLRGVPGFFSPRMCSPFALNLPVEPEAASFYDNTPLADTLDRLINFDYLNAEGGIRLSINAMHVTSGKLVSFDSELQPIALNHIMASGALPPGMPPVRVDGELYWDGGLFSNTPLETVLDDTPQVDTLCFMVDLWSAQGPEPKTIEEVRTRQKDVNFASRSQIHIDQYLRSHKIGQLARSLCRKLPDEFRSIAELRELSAMATDTTMHVVRLMYGGRDWHMAAKDLNFSRGSIHWRWEQGYRDASRSIEQALWQMPTSAASGIVLHDLDPHIADRH